MKDWRVHCDLPLCRIFLFFQIVSSHRKNASNHRLIGIREEVTWRLYYQRWRLEKEKKRWGQKMRFWKRMEKIATFLIVPNGPLRALASTLSSLSSRGGHQYRYCGDIHERRRTACTKLAAQHCCNVAKTNDLCCTYNMISPVSHAPRIGSQFRWHAPRVYLHTPFTG